MTEAESYDLDGVIISSPIPFQFDIVLKYFHVDPVRYEPPAILSVRRTVEETYVMSVRDAINYVVQSGRSVDIDTWQYLWDRTADVFGNTGRPNKRPWVDMTNRTLERGLVFPRFKEIFFRPKDISGIQSKGAAILGLTEQYDHVTHYDDDPWIVFGLAKAFPHVSFVLVQDLDSGILVSREEMERFPNVRRLARLRYSEPEYVHINKDTPSETDRDPSYFESSAGDEDNLDKPKQE